MTDLLIFCGDEKDMSLDGLSQETLEGLSFREDFTFDRWKAWCKFINKNKFDNYIFLTRQSAHDPLYLVYGIVNIKLFEKVFLAHEQNFKKIDPLITFSKALKELQNSSSPFWNAAFADHYLCGLLYGYGEANAAYFAENLQSQKAPTKFSEKATEGFIRLPMYAISGADPQNERYKRQKKTIEEIYKNRDPIQITMEQLSALKQSYSSGK